MVLGLLEPTAGTIRVFGKDLRTHRSEIASRMNFAAHDVTLPGNLTIWENLYVFGLLYEVKNIAKAIEDMMVQMKLKSFASTKTGFLSSGEQTRTITAKAFLNRPELVLLDEPTASLDPENSHYVRRFIRERAVSDRVGILWTSHNMYEVEAVCDRVLFLSHGRILLEGDPKILPRDHGKKTLEELFLSVADKSLHRDI